MVYIPKQKKVNLAYTLGYFPYELIAKIPSLILLRAVYVNQKFYVLHELIIREILHSWIYKGKLLHNCLPAQ